MEEEKRAASDISIMDEGVELAPEEEEDVILPGFRFHPTDDELVGFYLRRKVEGRPISIEIIKQADIYKYDPWDLPRVSNVGDKEWYFFCLRGRKYRNSIRPNRVTGSGFWKATGIDRPIYGASKNDCVGLKKSLVYYRGSAGKGTKTDWMMHEFRLPPVAAAAAAAGDGKTNNIANNGGTQEGETWTICRIFKRTVFYKRHAQAQSWRSDGAPVKQEPAAGLMIPNGCSAESNSDDEYRQRAALTGFRPQSDNNSVITCYEETLQPNADQWSSSTTQAPSPVSIANDLFFRDSCWDELARVVELSADPFVAYNC